MRTREPGEPPYAGYTSKVDVYSLGIVFFWLIAGVPPFNRHDMHDDETFANKVLNGRFKIPADVEMSKEALQFILACCITDD